MAPSLPAVCVCSLALFFVLLISSRKAVTHADLSNWEYYDVIRQAADPRCSANILSAIETIDILLEDPNVKDSVKDLFGLKNLKHDDDFASVLGVR